MNHAEVRSRLADNLHAVEERIRAACARSGRQRDEVTLVAVTKYVTPEVAALLPELGVLDLGESRPQELWRKADALPKEVRWHLIGHLQRNKVDRTLPLVHLTHAVDSVRLLDAIQAVSNVEGGLGHPSVLLEFNMSREPAKHGFSPDDLETLAAVANVETSDDGLQIVGLMTMAAATDDPEQARPVFAALRQLRDSLPRVLPSPAWVYLRELSMGMTNDFEVAIEEGATLIRVGSALFAGIEDGCTL
jgi:pyridoxal phosphate enzyme (YggS family)